MKTSLYAKKVTTSNTAAATAVTEFIMEFLLCLLVIIKKKTLLHIKTMKSGNFLEISFKRDLEKCIINMLKRTFFTTEKSLKPFSI